jgi:hypothetical protein
LKRHPAALAQALVVALAVSPGCSLMASSRQTVTITATDPNAEILVDGNRVGTGSASVQLKRDDSHTVLARVGERTAAASIGTEISTTGVLDIVGGIFFLIPLIGIAGPGFWDLEPTAITLTIPPAA